jgi:peptide/nickel transport system substrate-binding protein
MSASNADRPAPRPRFARLHGALGSSPCISRLRPSRGAAAAVAVMLAAGAAAGCSSSGSSAAAPSGSSGSTGDSGGTGATGGTLTVGWTSTPISMNPSVAAEGRPNIYYEVAYDSLLAWSPDGTVGPDLATSWGYVGTSQKVFRVTLRPNAEFADGEAVTPAAVAASINYNAKGTGAGPATLKTVTATVTGSEQVTLTSTIPLPDMDTLLTNFYGGAAIISPKGLADPKALSTQTYGAGEYVLDAAATVADEKYTYTANPHYWDPSAIHYKTLVIDVIADPTSAIAELRSGQIDAYFGGNSISTAEAKAAGLQVLAGPGYSYGVWDGLELIDRSGAVVKALGSLQVRQALEYAINRSAIVDALYGAQYAEPEVQPGLPTFDGYTKALESTYPYNPTKAKQLLAAAGYPNGFTIPVTMQITDEPLMKAIAGQLAQVGVTLAFHTETSIGGEVSDIFSGKIGAYDLQVSEPSLYQMVTALYLPSSPRNGLHQITPEFQKLFNTASAATSASAATADWAALETYMVQDAYTVPVVAEQNFYYLNTTTTSTAPNKITDYLSPLQLSPKN